jgi:hypothetical protein
MDVGRVVISETSLLSDPAFALLLVVIERILGRSVPESDWKGYMPRVLRAGA